MSEKNDSTVAAKPQPPNIDVPRSRRSFPWPLSLLVVALAAAGLAYALARPGSAPPETAASIQLAFKDAEGTTFHLSDFEGRTVLLNIWATWCVPCREEMPSLDRLQARYGGPEFEVVAVSTDALYRVQPFFAEIGITNLRAFVDQTTTFQALGLIGLPTTILIDKDGRSIRRWAGPVEWDSPEAIAMLEPYLPQAGPRAEPDISRQPEEAIR